MRRLKATLLAVIALLCCVAAGQHSSRQELRGSGRWVGRGGVGAGAYVDGRTAVRSKLPALSLDQGSAGSEHPTSGVAVRSQGRGRHRRHPALTLVAAPCRCCCCRGLLQEEGDVSSSADSWVVPSFTWNWRTGLYLCVTFVVSALSMPAGFGRLSRVPACSGATSNGAARCQRCP